MRSTSEKINYIIFIFIGALAAFFVPPAELPPVDRGVLGQLISFELTYANVIMIIGAVWLLYCFTRQKVGKTQALLMCGALGFISSGLILALLRILRKR